MRRFERAPGTPPFAGNTFPETLKFPGKFQDLSLGEELEIPVTPAERTGMISFPIENAFPEVTELPGRLSPE
jgi:hypothetical protein